MSEKIAPVDQREAAKEALNHAVDELTRATLDHCVKCTICETACPVARVTPLFSGPKFVGPQAERFRHGESVDHSLDYCSSCGICTLSCPQGVKIAELNSQARAVMKADHMPVRDRLMTQTMLEGMVMSPVAPIANAALEMKPVRYAIEKVVGVHRDAPMPTAHRETLQAWMKKRTPSTTVAEGVAKGSKGPVVFFTGCAGGFFEVETSKKSIELLEFLGYEVLVPKQGCCGLAEQSNGLFEQATKSVLKLCRQLQSAGKDLTIISSSGSCGGMLKHEAHEIMGVDAEELRDVGTRVRDMSEFLLELDDAGELPAITRRMDMTVPYHQPCQVKSQGMGMPAMHLLERIPGLRVAESGQPCCGIAGTYGLKKEKYEIAQAVGKPVFEHMKKHDEGVGACDTETCRWQIRKGSGVNVVHPVEILHYAYGLSDDLFDAKVGR